MRLVIFGAGATGGVLAARLSRAGESVVLVARGPHAESLARSGLVLEGLTEGRFSLAVVTEVADAGAVDGVALTVKSPDLEAAGEAVARALDPPVPVLALQNGIGIEPRLLCALRAGGWARPEPWVARGVTSMGATLVGPGRVRHAGEGEILLGLPVPGSGDPAGFWAERLTSAGFAVRRVADLRRELWRKLLVNAAVNPVTADHGIPNGQLTQDPWRGQALGLLAEAVAVARAEGLAFTDAEAEADLWRVVRATATNRSSMLQDLEHGRPTEIEAITGELLRLGRLHGLRLPASERALARIRAKARAGSFPAGKSS